MRALLIVGLLLSAGCGGETVEPLSARFPLGPKQAALAVIEAHPRFVSLEENRWKASAPRLEVDLVAVRSAVLDVGTRGEGELRAGAASVSTDLVDAPFSKVELLLGPGDAGSIGDARVVPVADAQVPRAAGAAALLRWRDGGEARFLEAMAGEDGSRVALFLRGTATLTLEPGSALPPLEAEGHITVNIPLRTVP